MEKIKMEKITKDMVEMIGLHGIIAFFGGVVAYLSKAEQPKFLKIIIAGVIGSFTGVIFGLLASLLTDSQYIMLAIAGIGGTTGKEGMEWLFGILKRVVNRKV